MAFLDVASMLDIVGYLVESGFWLPSVLDFTFLYLDYKGACYITQMVECSAKLELHKLYASNVNSSAFIYSSASYSALFTIESFLKSSVFTETELVL